VDQENVSKIKELEQKNRENEALQQKIKVENLNLQKTQIEIQAEENRSKAEQYSVRLIQVEKEFSLKNNELKTVNEKLIINASKLIDSAEKLSNIKTDYAEYKEKVKKITEYMAGYGPGYAKGVLGTESGKSKMKEIAELPNANDRAREIEIFTMNIINQTFNKYTSKKNGELSLIEK
jgi:DNA repair exonuclease SbcCD ATPase subunit